MDTTTTETRPHPLEEYRLRRGLKLTELAQQLDCSVSLLSRIIGGTRRLTPELAKKWSPILRISRERLCPEIFGRD